MITPTIIDTIVSTIIGTIASPGIPPYAIKDRDGNYILDRDGNYITNPPRPVSASTLLTGLVSWWSMDETSGTRADSHGSNDLTDNNTVDYTAGKVGNAASFTYANKEWLSNSSPIGLQGGERDYTFAQWIYIGAGTPNYGGTMTCNTGIDNTPSNFDYMACWTGGVMQFFIGVGSNWKIVASTASFPVPASWYLMICSHENSTKTLRISINAGSEDSLIYTGTPNEVAAEVHGIGTYAQSHDLYWWDGYIDESAFWSRLLTSDERTELYNSGAGIGYPS